MAPPPRRARVRRAVLAIALLALASPLALAQVAQQPASVLVYHAPGGRDPDPLASALAPLPMGADRLPATFFDRADRASSAPENAPERALAHFREMQRLLLARESVPAALALTLAGELAPGTLRVEASVSRPAEVTFVLFEHGVPLAGRPQPYVARFVAEPVNVSSDASPAVARIALDPAWAPDRIGVVAIARVDGEVAQSATWTTRLDAPVVQTGRAVLIEHVTASWCDPCQPADAGLALLATQRGVAGPLDAGDVRYFRAPEPIFYVGLSVGALAAIALLRRSPP